MQTLEGWVRSAGTKLDSKGYPPSDARRLAMKALGCTFTELVTRGSEAAPESLDDLLESRLGGTPLAWLEESAPFYGREFEVTRDTLTPRPETETLVDAALRILDATDAMSVMDVGTGTGCVAASLKLARPEVQVWASEISPATAEVADRNFANFKVDIPIFVGDLLAGAPIGSIDIVVSNPPYIPHGTTLPNDVTMEPKLALFADEDGNAMIRRLAALEPRVGVAIEIGTPEQAEYALGALARYPHSGIDSDLTGRPRVVWAHH